jgi:glycosyltransferase involved in cell wall biosynthesis
MDLRVRTIPCFSIVIPTYNREVEVQRAITSCLRQDFLDFEVIVVDDASTDATSDVVRKLADKASAEREAALARALPVWERLRLVECRSNSGTCRARNIGVSLALGEWIIFLDSDDALVPTALARISDYALQASPEIGRFGFMYEWHDGTSSPRPTPRRSVAGYEAYLSWVEDSTRWDMIWCTRRSTFETIRFPESYATELEYHLDFAASFDTAFVPEIAAEQFADAPARLTNGGDTRDAGLHCQRIRDEAWSLERILTKHGEALKTQWPRTRERVVREKAILHLMRLATEKGPQVTDIWLQYWKKCNPCLKGLIGVLLASLHPSLYLRAREVKRTWTGPV